MSSSPPESPPSPFPPFGGQADSSWGDSSEAGLVEDSRVGRHFGKYVLTRRIGQGGMGVVYEAEDTILKRRVAIKLLGKAVSGHSHALARFLREARAAARLNHPNVVSLYEIDQHEDSPFLVLELIEGGSAQQFLNAQGTFDWREATQIVADACRGLIAAHQAGLIHRDIKPGNIMRAGNGTVKLSDFGLVKTADASGTPLTASGQVVGTPEYMSPEQCRNDPLDERSDIYSLGATYYALLTGEPPYLADTALQVMFAICSHPVPKVRERNPRVPEACAAVLERAMAKAPAERYPSASALLADLEAILAAAPETPSPATRWTKVLPEGASAPAAPPTCDKEILRLLAPAEKPDELGRLGPYRVKKVLGEGGMGVVFQAEDPLLERPVALKVMKPDHDDADRSRRRYLQEAKASASLQHPHIVTIYQVGEDRGVPYLAMEFLQGESLEARLRREGRLPLAEAVRIAKETAEGLAAAHANGLIHRDIKPANIWLEAHGPQAVGLRRVKILDFGLARLNRDDGRNLTRTGMVVGTPGYMAPEQARGGLPMDGRADLFSLGCVLYHMLTGRGPFRRDDLMSTLLALATEEPDPLSSFVAGVPSELIALVESLLAKAPMNRPETARHVADRLAAMERRTDEPSPLASTPVPARNRADVQTHLQELGLGAAEQSVVAEHPADATPSSDWPSVPTLEKPAESTTTEAPAIEGAACPRCGATKKTGTGWCLQCGYYPELEKPAEEAPPPKSWGWLGVLLAGMIVVVLISAGGRWFCRTHPTWRTTWSTAEFVLGLLAIVAGHAWAFIVTLSQRDDHTIFRYLDMTRLWVYTFEELPRTRRPLWIGCWGLTAALAAYFLVGGLEFWIRPIGHRLPARARTDESSSDYADSYDYYQAGEEELLATPKDVEEPEEKRLVLRCDVIGYIARDAGGEIEITGLVLAAPHDGKLRHAGTLTRTRGADARGFEDLLKLPVLSDPVITVPISPAGIFWVQPALSCEVEYSRADANGELADPVFKKW